ncbi:unnamed protein product [Prunus armeniaca]
MEDKAMMLMISLPPSYKHFLMTLMIYKSTLNFEEVDQDVMLHHRMAQCSKEGPQDVSLERGRTSKREGKEGNVWKEKRNKLKNVKSASAANMSIDDANDELVMVTDKECIGEVVVQKL